MGHVGIKFNRIPCVFACWAIFRNCYWLDYIRFDFPSHCISYTAAELVCVDFTLPSRELQSTSVTEVTESTRISKHSTHFRHLEIGNYMSMLPALA
jgi:hypothetical protein